MKKHYVEFFSPGTFFDESTVKEVSEWETSKAIEQANSITERYNATPFAFQFFTKERSDNDFEPKITEKSNLYYLGGTVLTLKEIKDRNNEADSILVTNMERNGYDKVIENTNSFRTVRPLRESDVILDYKPMKEQTK